MNNWLLFSILAPCCWAFSNVLDGAVRRHYIKHDMAMTWFISLTRLPVIIIFLLIFNVKIPINSSDLLFMILGGALWILPYVFHYKAVEFEEISRIALLGQMIPIFVVFISYFALNEILTANQWLSFILIFSAGIIASLHKVEGNWRLSKAFWLILTATFMWAASDVIFKKFEPGFDDFLSAFFFYFCGSFSLAVVMPFFPKSRAVISQYFFKKDLKMWGLLILDQIFGISGSMAFAYALTIGKASLTAVLIGTQPLFAFIFGLILIRFIPEVVKENLSRRAIIIKSLSFVMIIIGLVAL
jgi:drug/metabolite transporter (DMT)-like permease